MFTTPPQSHRSCRVGVVTYYYALVVVAGVVVVVVVVAVLVWHAVVLVVVRRSLRLIMGCCCCCWQGSGTRDGNETRRFRIPSFCLSPLDTVGRGPPTVVLYLFCRRVFH